MKAFSCPQCGASLESRPIDSSTVECPYCHSAVIVPPELRPAPRNDHAEEEASKPGLSFVGKIGAIIGGTLFVLFLVIIFKPENNPKQSSSRPQSLLPQMSPKASPAPTPSVLTFGEGTGPGLFKDAQEVAVDGAGNIYVSDDTQRIQKFDAQGNFLKLWTIPTDTQYFTKIRGGPDRLLADREGRVYAVIGGVVLRFDGADGQFLGAARGSDYIYDAALKADGGMAIVSGQGEAEELVLMDAKGKATKRVHQFISSQLDKQIPVEAVKVAADGVGNIYGIYALGSIYGEHYYDNEDLAVFKFAADGRYINRFSGGGKEPGQFDSPNAIAVDSHGFVYVCDLTQGIHVFTEEGRYLKSLATPFWAQGMAFDAAGDLLVVGDNKVSRIKLSK
ncbi:MAG: hypothetical protein JO360_15755 [Acidobacteria bacterium]|nr:hypothetical protein [Acidobacteriota bacterium]